MGRFPQFLWLPFATGSLFAGLFVFMWGAYAVGKADVGGIVFITAVQVFTLPLLVGSILLMRKRKSGFVWLKFGSVCFIVDPFHLVRLWTIELDPEFQAWMSAPSDHGFH